MPASKQLSPAVKVLVTARFKEKRERERKQRKLIGDEELHWDTIGRKLNGLFNVAQFENFSRCGVEKIFRTCEGCSDVQSFTYSCNIKWCPKCNWKIGRRRAEMLREWLPRVRHPMHLVLTQKNFPVLTTKKLREHQKNLARIRRSKCFKHVKGGCLSVEITNEGNGWHLHSHWMIDATFVPMDELSRAWGKLVGQEFGIVHFSRLAEKDYCNEVCKYVVKPGEMADWPAEQIHEFVRAIRGRRFFFAFGSLFHEARAVKAALLAKAPGRKACECGCGDFIFQSEADCALHEIRSLGRKK